MCIRDRYKEIHFFNLVIKYIYIKAKDVYKRQPQIRPVVRDTFFQQMDKYGYRGAIERQFKKRFLKYNLKCFIRKVIPKRVVARILKNP